MDSRTLFEFIRGTQCKIIALFESKNQGKTSYGNQADGLNNFTIAANMDGCTRVKALWGMVIKHIAELKNKIDKHESGTHIAACEWDKQLLDIIVYMHILRGMVHENIDNDRPQFTTGNISGSNTDKSCTCTKSVLPNPAGEGIKVETASS